MKIYIIIIYKLYIFIKYKYLSIFTKFLYFIRIRFAIFLLKIYIKKKSNIEDCLRYSKNIRFRSFEMSNIVE